MDCPECGSALPADADACPNCAAWHQVHRMRRVGAMLKGAAGGLALGLLVVTVLLARAEYADSFRALLLALPLLLAGLGAVIAWSRTKSSS